MWYNIEAKLKNLTTSLLLAQAASDWLTMINQQIKFLTLEQNEVKLGRQQNDLFGLLAALEEHLSSRRATVFRRLPRLGE